MSRKFPLSGRLAGSKATHVSSSAAIALAPFSLMAYALRSGRKDVRCYLGMNILKLPAFRYPLRTLLAPGMLFPQLFSTELMPDGLKRRLPHSRTVWAHW